MILIVVKWTIRPEYADQWMDRVAEFTASTRAEPGNLFFEWNRSVDDPTVYTLVEGFREDAAVAHVTSDHFTTAMSWMPDVVAARPSIINTTIPQDGWSEMAEVTPR
jgi:quinol monooxygenase YgiN